ncbi:MAG: hypothetical protein NZ561_13275, partial [Phycisphaerae bacterium]|nr:hypothetical protein [Phycisphaerae bacterium]MDW8263498.1 glucoamylase family protein [Phycisphaerales bacterium]
MPFHPRNLPRSAPATAPLQPIAAERLEQRLLWSGTPLPLTLGREFTVDSWDHDVTASQFAWNDFAGPNGRLIETSLTLSPESNSPIGNSLRLTKGPGSLGGYFTYFFGPGSADGVPMPGRFLDTQDFFRGFGAFAGRTIEQLKFDLRHSLPAPLVIKLELKDEAGRIVSATRTVPHTGSGWTTVTLNLPADFTGPPNFDYRRIDHLVFVVEDAFNSPNWTFLLDNLRLVDIDGTYPDFAAMTAGDGTLLPQYTPGFLDYLRQLTSLYFFDFASPLPATGGMIQDSSRSVGLLTVGGVGFQLNSYIICAERGYLPRSEAAERTVKLLRALHEGPQGSGSTGFTGYQGFFYHFLHIDGRREPGSELSPIDTALAIAGVLTAGQYFTGPEPIEAEIRTLAEQIYSRVNWRFMLNNAPGPRQNQFFLAWKPETNLADYQHAVPGRAGRFSGTASNPLTIDYYTDEGLLVALLAMGAPNPAYRVGREAWDAIFRAQNQGSQFIQSYSGSLFTYQFASVWLDTAGLGSDNHPSRPVNFHQNTRSAIHATRNYAIANPTNRDTWLHGAGTTRWGLSAAAGPFDVYFADAAPPAALNINQNQPLEVGVVTPYGVGSSLVHEPQLAIPSLWQMARQEDLNQDGKPDLLHPRFGFADAFTLDIGDATGRGGAGGNIRPPIGSPAGPWANSNGYAIDHGPMLSILDNYLSGQFIPRLFMSHPGVRVALNQLFPALAPAVLAGQFPFELAPHRVTIRFSENVQGSLSPADLVLTNRTTGAVFTGGDLTVSYDPSSDVATFTFA